DVAERPEWGGWGGRHGHNPAFPGRAYFFASRLDSFNGTTNRDNTLLRWAPDIQNEFKARLDWCVQTPREANHPPLARINGGEQVILTSGAKHVISASMS